MIFNRYQIFDFAPNWADGVSMKYSFNTSVYMTEHYKEQRKPLRLRPWLNMKYNVMVDLTAPRAIDFLRAALNSIMFVPVWTEPLKIIGSSGATTWEVDILTEDNTNLFCLYNLVMLLVLIDRTGARNPTIVGISSRSSGSVGIVFNVENEWTIDSNTMAFPAMLMMLDSMKKISYTPSLEEVQVSFRDYVYGGFFWIYE